MNKILHKSVNELARLDQLFAEIHEQSVSAALESINADNGGANETAKEIVNE